MKSYVSYCSTFALVAVVLFCTTAPSNAFQPPVSVLSSSRLSTVTSTTNMVLFEKKKGVGSSGYRQERLNRLADLEEERIETDKGFVLKATGAFVGLIVVLLAAAYSSGILTQY